MESADLQVLSAAVGWLEQGRGVTLVTVTGTWGSSPRPPGSLLALRDDGRAVGSVSGGCVEEDLAGRVRRQPPQAPQRLSYGIDAQHSRRFGLPCGGRLDLVLEPLHGLTQLQVLVGVIEARGVATRRLCLTTGESGLHPGGADQPAFRDRGATLEKVFGPRWQLLIIGAGQAAQFLAEMARALDYRVVVCDPRVEVAAAWQVPGTELDTAMPDDVVRARADDGRSAVVALTHDPKLDDMALMEALDSRAFYVGALGSRASSEQRRARLRQLGVSPAGLARLHGPVGLPLGGRTPAEIAVAVAADLVAVRHGRRLELLSAPQTVPVVEAARGVGP